MVKTKYTFKELADIKKLYKLYGSFSNASSFTVDLINQQTKEVLISIGSRDICTKFHRTCKASKQHCHSSDKNLTLDFATPDEVRIDYCKNGLINGSTPIIIEGTHLATVSSKQILFTPPDTKRFEKQAKEFSYDDSAYLEALKKVPIVNEETFIANLKFLALLATMVAEHGLTELRLQKASKTTLNQKYLLDSLIDSIPDIIFYKDKQSVYLGCNKAYEEYTGRSKEQLLGLTDLDLYPKKTAQIHIEKDRQVLYDKKNHNNEEWIEYPDGRRALVDLLKAPYFNSNDSVVGLIGICRDNTKKKIAENALHKKEELLRTLINSTPDIICFKDGQGRWLEANDAVIELFQLDNVDYHGKKDSELAQYSNIYHDAFMSCKKSDERAWAKGGLSRAIEIIPKQDGSEKVYDVIKVPLFKENTSRKGMVILGRDITEMKKAEEALRKSEKRYRKIFEESKDILFISSKEGCFLDINPAGLQLLGYSSLDDIQKIDITRDLYRDQIDREKYLQQIGEYGFIKDYELPLKKKDGSTITVKETTTAVYDDEDNTITYRGIMRDVTLQKEYEEEIVRLATVVKQSTQVVVITDLKGAIQYVNPAFEKSTGYTFSEARGKNPRILQSGEQGQDFYKKMWNTISTGKSWDGIFSNKKKDGTLYYEKAVIFPIKDANSQITNFAAIKQDISNEIALKQQLQQAQKMESIGTLAGGVAHDFNNLLTVINGYTAMSLMGIDETNPLYNNLLSIQQAGKRATSLTSQLLAFSRKQIYKAETLALNSVISSLETMLRRLIGEDIHMETILANNLPNIKADKSQLEQVLINLIVNARDAISTVTEFDFLKKITITTGQVLLDDKFISKHPGSDTGENVFFTISDNGIGIDEATRKRIFEPFFTTKAKCKGTGLGLSMVYGIVKQNKGYIDVSSHPGKGTIFTIYWPTTETCQTQKENKRNKISTGSEIILFVEDDEHVLNFATKALTDLGYQVIKAANGRLALELIEQNNIKFDLLITDVIMPELNGKKLTQQVIKRDPDVQVIFISGYTDNIIAQNGLLDEDINFIHKPFSIQTLATKVRQVLNNR